MIKKLLMSVQTMIDKSISKLNYDKTFPSAVQTKNGTTYGINKEGRIYEVYNALGTDLALGTLVWVKIPDGQLRNMHICGIRK